MSELFSTIEVFAVGTPKAQPRVKAFKRGNHAGVYDPGTANDWKSSVRDAFKEFHGLGIIEPVTVRIDFHLPRPKSHYGKRGLKDSAPLHHTGKPDLDNAAKAVLDAMTDFQFWKDDSAVVRLVVTKSWALSRPGARVIVNPMNQPAHERED